MAATISDTELKFQRILLAIVCCLVDHTDDVEITIVTGGASSVLRVYVNPLDLGKLIGKQGRTARSLRTIVCAAAMKAGRRFDIDIVNPAASATTCQTLQSVSGMEQPQLSPP
jgi:predicted RNA-binding protein YlqC (UPF0109 family)